MTCISKKYEFQTYWIFIEVYITNLHVYELKINLTWPSIKKTCRNKKLVAIWILLLFYLQHFVICIPVFLNMLLCFVLPTKIFSVTLEMISIWRLIVIMIGRGEIDLFNNPDNTLLTFHISLLNGITGILPVKESVAAKL